MAEDDGQVKQLQAELEAVKTKLAKSEASKQRLKEHWALLKEKVINAHTLCDERDALAKQLSAESAARAEAQEELNAAVEQKAVVDRACAALSQQKGRLDQLLDAAAAEKQRLEQRLAQAVQAADKAKHQHQAAIKQCNAAQAAMENMQKQLNKLQHALEQLQQQQVISRLSSLEQQWRQLLDREHLLTVDQQELARAVKPPMQHLLQQQVEPRLSSVEQDINKLQQQLHQGGSAVATGSPAGQQQLPPSAGDIDRRELQTSLDSVVVEQRRLRAAVNNIQQQLSTLQDEGGTHVRLNAGRQQLAGFIRATVASAGPSREMSPAAAAAAPTQSTTASALHAAAGMRQAAEHLRAIQRAGTSPAAASGAAAAGDVGSGEQSTRVSSMFGTTMLHASGLSSSYSYGDHTGSPSEASAQQQSQQQHSTTRKRTWQQQQQKAAAQQVISTPLPQCAGSEPGRQTPSVGRGLLQVGKSVSTQQQHTQQQKVHSGSAMSGDMSAASSSSSDDPAETECQQSAKRQKPWQHQQQQQRAQQGCKVPQQQQGIRLAPASQTGQQQSLMEHFQAVEGQQADAAALAKEVVQLVVAGKLQLHDIVGASCSSLVSAAAAEFDVGKLQQRLSKAMAQQGQQQLQGVEHLGDVGWVACQHGAAKVAVYQQRLASYVRKLSDLLQQQQQQQTAAKSDSHGAVQGWPAAAPCWHQLLAELTSSSWLTQAASAASEGTIRLPPSTQQQQSRTDCNLLQKVADQLMQPVYQACRAAAMAASGQRQHKWVRQQQEVSMSQACGAAAAATRLCRAAGDRQAFHCILVRLILAGAQGLSHHGSSGSIRDCPMPGRDDAACCGSLFQHLACITAAIGAWPEALKLDALQIAAVSLISGSAGGPTAATQCYTSLEEQMWQLVLLDPVLVAIWSCLLSFAQTAAAAPENAANARLISSHDGSATAAAGGTRQVAVLGQALLLVLHDVPRIAFNSTSGPCAAAGGAAARPPTGTCQSKGQGSKLDSEMNNNFKPLRVLGQVLGVLRVLLQKQHPALPGGWLDVPDEGLPVYSAALCVAVQLLASVAEKQQWIGLMVEFEADLLAAAGESAVVHQVVQALSSVPAVERS